MNMNIEPIKTPNQDTQGRSYDLLSPTQVLTGQQQQQQQQHQSEPEQPQMADKQKHKKKCRGDRKEQRRRRRLRRKGLDPYTITELDCRKLNFEQQEEREQQHHQVIEQNISDKTQVYVPSEQMARSTPNNIDHHDNKMKKSIKRKRRDTSSKPSLNTIDNTLSQLSISQPSPKKPKIVTNEIEQVTTNGRSETQRSKSKKQINRNNDASYIPDYLKVSNRIFKKMLINSLEGAKKIVKRLNSKEKINYIRQYAYLIHRLFYVQLQESQWKYYYDIGMEENIWYGRVSKKWAAMNSMNYTYGRSKTLIIQRLKTIARQIQQASQALQNFGNQPLPQCISELNPPLDFTNLNAIVTAVVRKGQHKLKQQFEHNKKMLILDSTDHHLVQQVYDLKPNKQQIRCIRNIWQAIQNEKQMEEQIKILKHRIHSNCLPPAFNLLDYSLDKIDKILNRSKQSSTNDNDNKQQTILNARRLKKIGRFKYDMLELSIAAGNDKVRHWSKIAKKEKQKLITITDKLKKNNTNSDMFKQLMEAIEAREKHMIERADYITQQKLNQSKLNVRNHPNILLSLYFANTLIPLSNEQLLIINKGLKFIPPCQSRFLYKEPIEKIIDEEYKRLRTENCKNLTKYTFKTDDTRATEYFSDVKHLLEQLYTKPLPKKLKANARYIYKMIKSMQRKLRKANITVGQTDKSKLFFFIDTQEYEEKVKNYMNKTNAYQEITSGICPLADDLHLVILLLDHLHERKEITYEQYTKMYPNLKTLELAHLYFNLKVHKPEISVRPIIASINAPARLISSFLDQLLTPIYNYVTKNITFINSTDLIRKLKEYEQKGYLTSTTLFVIFDVTDLYTMIPRDGAIAALRRFCQKYSTNGKIGNLKVETIIKLASVVLDTNSFAYKDKYYRQIKGGAMGSPFTMVLANIYMLEWEQKLIQHQHQHHEIYGRYIDDVFMTTNLSKEEILQQLDETMKTDPNIKITITISQTLEYLDATIENNNGQLKTSIYHKSSSEPYILPYESDHPRHIHANIINTALVRAARICSTVEDFDMERLSIEMKLLVNGYPPKFIQHHFKNFFLQNDAINMWTELNSETYQKLHHTLLYKPTRRENKNNAQSNDQFIQKQTKYEHKDQIYLHYTFESGPVLSFKKEYRKIWQKHYVYPGSRCQNTRLILGTLLNRTLQTLLIHKKPKRAMLTLTQPMTQAPDGTEQERLH
ncbi:unnamed protein product, partial [Rotaria sp. Silwood1]